MNETPISSIYISVYTHWLKFLTACRRNTPAIDRREIRCSFDHIYWGSDVTKECGLFQRGHKTHSPDPADPNIWRTQWFLWPTDARLWDLSDGARHSCQCGASRLWMRNEWGKLNDRYFEARGFDGLCETWWEDHYLYTMPDCLMGPPR